MHFPFQRLLNYYNHNGLNKTADRLLCELIKILSCRMKFFTGGSCKNRALTDDATYRLWIEKNEPSDQELKRQRKQSCKFAFAPKISIITPVFNPDPKILQETLDSVARQSYENWQLCLANASTEGPAKDILESFAGKYSSKVKLTYLEKNLGISGNSNEALSLATGEYVAFLDHDDVLAPFAMFELVRVLNKVPDAEFLFSDRDIMDCAGKRMYPFFKPGWSPDFFLSQNYLCHIAVVKKDLLDQIGWFRSEFDGSQDYDLFLRATETAKKIIYIPKILYHWRTVEGSSAIDSDAKPYAYDAAIRALNAALDRRGLKAKVVHGRSRGFYKVNFKIERKPLITVILIVDQQIDLPESLVKRFLNKTDYNRLQITAVYSEGKKNPQITSRLGCPIHQVICPSQCSVSKILNDTIRKSSSEVLVLLLAGAEIVSQQWLNLCMGLIQRRDIGAVGPKIIDSDGRIISAGLTVSKRYGLRRICKDFAGDSPGYNRLLQCPHNVSAFENAFLVFKKESFDRVGGFDERLSLLYVVDFCLKLRQAGYNLTYNPDLEVILEKSFSKEGNLVLEIMENSVLEERLFWDKWSGKLEDYDPYYNPNLDPLRCDYSLRNDVKA